MKPLRNGAFEKKNTAEVFMNKKKKEASEKINVLIAMNDILFSQSLLVQPEELLEV